MNTGALYTYQVARLTDRPSSSPRRSRLGAGGGRGDEDLPVGVEIMALDRDVEKLVHEHHAVFVPAKA